MALCIIERGDTEVLLVKRPHGAYAGAYAGYWGLPGGKFLPEEDGDLAVIREVREETGILLGANEKPSLCGLVLERVRDEASVVGRWQLYIYQTRIARDLVAAGGSHEARWFSTSEVQAEMNVVPNVREIVRGAARMRSEGLDFFMMDDTVKRTGSSFVLAESTTRFYRLTAEVKLRGKDKAT